MTISPMASSATLRVLENGALNTGTPTPRAASRLTWLVPTLKQPTAISRSAEPTDIRRQLGARADAEQVNALERLKQLLPVQGFG